MNPTIQKVLEVLSANPNDTLITDITHDDIFETLKAADDAYHNGPSPIMTDAEFDTLRKYAESAHPHHVYFTGVGADVRGGKIKLPYQMGSLDQVEVGEIEDWIARWNLDKENITITDKLDGTSAMVVYDGNGDLQIAYSRGNGVEGADITRHIKHLVPTKVSTPHLVVRGEVIISKTAFPILVGKVMSRSGQPYKNARNMVAGLMNADKNNDIVYDYMDFVAYEILKYEGNKNVMLKYLMDDGFDIPYSVVWRGEELNDEDLAQYLNDRRAEVQYEIDGLVLDVNSLDKRNQMNPTRDTLNPAYAVKYKVADASNIAVTTVKSVTWNVSKHAYLKPQVNVEPVQLVGVTVSNATGFNAKFIKDNNIGPGAQIQITRSGDVIPFIQKVVTPADMPLMPEGDWHWSENAVDAILDDADGVDTVDVKSITSFFSSIEAPHLKEGNVVKLYEAGYNTVESIINASASDLVNVIGSNGQKIYDGVHVKLTNIPLYKIIGAYSTERGIGVRKIKKLQDALGRENLFTGNATIFADVDGFDEKTAARAQTALEAFHALLNKCGDHITIAEDVVVEGGGLSGEKIAFTGFRDRELQEKVERLGGIMQSSVSSKTTILVASNPNSTSGKMKKARDAGAKIMCIDEFKELV